MADVTKSTALDLNEVLDAERNALLNGNFDQLADLLERKQALLESVDLKMGITPSELMAIRHKATRNEELLASALEGIRAVSERMSELRKIRQGLETYDSAGRKTRHGCATERRLEKRA